jgi:hypothetical protein
MRIMARDSTNKVNSVKLLDGRNTQTGKGTLQELCRVHFPDSKLIDGSADSWGQPDLDMHIHRVNREDWHLARRVIDQSKIKWAVHTFKPFKSVGITE